MNEEKQMTGYPSIDKPWLKYYSDEAINNPLPEETMYQYIWDKNKDHLRITALDYFGTRISYEQLFNNIKKTAAMLHSQGVRSGDIVTVMSVNTPETIYTIYALNYIGATANMVYMTLSEAEIIDAVNSTNSKLFIVLDVVLNRIEGIKDKINTPVIVLDVSDSMPIFLKVGYRIKNKIKRNDYLLFRDLIKEKKEMPPLALDSNSSAVIVYTSGSTGEPKGVELTNKNINAVAFQYKFVDVSIERGDTILTFMPPFLSIGLCYIHMPLSLGVTLLLCANPEPAVIANEYVKKKPNHFVGAPSNIMDIIQKDMNDYSFVKSLGAGGEALSVDNMRLINEQLLNGKSKVKCSIGYGMTEFSAVVTTCSNSANKEGSMGIPLPLCNAKVIDTETGEEKKYGEIGELLFRTPSQMKEYKDNPVETENTVVTIAGKKWIRTGDLGYIDEDGFVFFTGRIKRIYLTKSGEGTLYKLFPQRIEEAIETNENVKRCGVIVKEHKEKLNVPIALVELKNQTENMKDCKAHIQKTLEETLPIQAIPEEIRIIDTIPLTQSGKIDYQLLEKKYHSI